MSEEVILSKKEGYEAMILMLYDFYKSTGSTDLTDVLSGGEYIDGRPADIAFWYMWEEAVEKIKNGHLPKEKKLFG
jgi:phage I-like protein